MIVRDGDGYRVEGALTLRTAAGLLVRGRQVFVDPVSKVDLSAVTELDSAALGLLLAWLREARSARREIVYLNLPENLESLGRLYGVLDLLPRARSV
jgi:phospholipid transport system transporter-binding protein